MEWNHHSSYVWYDDNWNNHVQVVIQGERRDDSGGQYDQICNARLPRALDPHSVPSEELSASLG